MDPLSIAATAIGLAETAAGLSIWLYELVKDIKNIDSKVSELCKEVSRLSGLLESVQKTVRECQGQALTLAHLDHQMWKHIASTLEDCESNLGGLEALLTRIRSEYDPEGNGLSRLLKKTNMNIYFTIHKDEIQDYTFKVMRSNCAMQTTLGVVSVSLNLRANISQENLFEELRILKGLVHEALRVSKRQETVPDASSTRQNENLGRLAEAAKQFHIVASSTASTNYSEIGIFTDAKREDVKRWVAGKLETTYESTEEDNFETDSPTAPVVSGRGVSPTGPVPIAIANQPPSTSEDSDDESDFDLDILRNFEELAFDSFVSQNYSKAEQCLRLAVQGSTGDTAESSNFRQLNTQLALCCCLQDKWDHASAILSSLLKVKSANNLPVLQLMQAVVIANIASSQLEEALETCRKIAQGMKKLFGKESEEYRECFWLFAIIHDKRGKEIEAEAARRSIPPRWAPANVGILNSPKAYILNNSTLVQSVFAKKTDDIPGSSRRSVQVLDGESELSDSREPTPQGVQDVPQLMPNESNEPTRGMRKVEREGTIEETDTGKEFFVPFSQPILDRISPSPINQHNTGTSMNSREGLGIHLPGNHTAMPMRSASGREFSIQTPVSASINGLGRSHSQNHTPGSQPESRAEAIKSLKRPILQIPSQDLERGPDAMDRPISRLETTQTGSNSSRREARQAPPQLNIPSEWFPHTERSKERLSPQSPYIEETIGSQIDGSYSTLEVVDTSVYNTSPSIERSPRSPATPTTPLTPLSSYAHQLTRLKSPSDVQNTEILRTRWTVRNDIGNIGEPRPRGPSSPSQFLPIFRSTPTPGTCFVGVSAGVSSASSIALNMGQEETTICQMPEKSKQDAPNQTPTLGVRDFFRKATYSIHSNRPKSPLTDDSRYTVDIAYPRHWPGEYEAVDSLEQTSQLLGDRRDLLAENVSTTRRIESEIARIMRRGQSASHSGAIISLRVEGVVYAIPDFLERTMWQSWTHILEKSMLLQHAKVIPKSYAVVQYYLDSGALIPGPDDPFVAPQAVIVLNGDEKLVDCVPYFLQRVSENYVEITESQSDYLAEMAGYVSRPRPSCQVPAQVADLIIAWALSKHAQVQFAKLVSDQLLLTVRELRRKVDESAIQDIIQSCCEQFERLILPDFENNGRDWTVEFEMPSGAPGLRHGRLKFTNAEVAKCLNRSVIMIEKMLESMVAKHIHQDIAVSHVLLAGSYSKSKYLRLCLEKKLSELRLNNKGALKLCYPSESDDICVLGALSHAIGSCTEER
ncbi:hsp70 family protein [Colletotrichum sojae]|uniref:Hsp70 family protein n=1 Tax=Colletotrichum sojae TaxID=2175907 RepID=A0A8H6JD74_9PEZI|nr:hsp70 family protein [Colletotrichum sojae]